MRSLHTFAAELPAPSKLQQWGCARFAISAARSAGASKDPQGAGQASKYVHCGSKGFKESQRGAARRGSVGFSKGFGAYSKMFAAELAAPSKLQQWAGASCKISAARSSGASKNPQGASQASTYFAVRATVKSLGLSGLRENSSSVRFFQGAKAPHICGGAARAFKTSGLRELRYICGAFSKDFKRSGRWSGLSVFCEGNRSCGKSRAERASKCLLGGASCVGPRKNCPPSHSANEPGS